jgi:hypothetical protein
MAALCLKQVWIEVDNGAVRLLGRQDSPRADVTWPRSPPPHPIPPPFISWPVTPHLIPNRYYLPAASNDHARRRLDPPTRPSVSPAIASWFPNVLQGYFGCTKEL